MHIALLAPFALAIAVPLAACEGEVQEIAHVDRPAPPDSPVVDAGQILSDEFEAELVERLVRYWNTEGTAIVVSTTDSLGGRTIEDYAFDEFNAWGIGDAETNRGILLLVAPNERKARIEVGCGLETILTDQVAARIMDDAIIANFREGRFESGVEAGVEDIMALLDSSDVEPGPVSPACIEIMREAA